MTLPALREIHRQHPEASLTVVVRPELAEFYRLLPEVGHVIVFSRAAGLTRLRMLGQTAREIRSARGEIYLCLPNSFAAALLGVAARIPVRLGYARDGRGRLLTRSCSPAPELARRHQVWYYLDLLHRTGLSPVDYLRQPGFTPDCRLGWNRALAEAALAVRQRVGLVPDEPVLGVHAGAYYGAAKRWPPERYAGVLRRLNARSGMRILLFGSAGENAAAEFIAGRAGPGVLNLCGKTGLLELLALIAQCRLFISNDSGPMHVAAAFGVPQLALFGSTDPVATGPFSARAVVLKKPVDCSPCFLRECPFHLECFERLDEDEVYLQAAGMLQKEYPSDRYA